MRYIYLLLSVIFGFIASVLLGGYIQFVLGIEEPNEIPIALEGTIEFFDAKWGIIGQDIGIILINLLCLFLFLYFYSLYRRYTKRKKNIFNVDNIQEPFILYLRSFVADRTTGKRISLAETISEEEAMVEAMCDIAPVYAIGDPCDKKMPNGASRIYVDDEHWKSTVMEMANRALLVVLRLGKTDSFWWEVEMAIKNLPIEKILFIVPENKTFNNISILYKILLEHNVNISNLDVTIENNHRGSISSFIYFNRDGMPQTSQVKTGRFTQLFLKYPDVIRKSLADLRARYGLSSPKITMRKARILQIFAIIGILFIGSVITLNHYTELKYQRPYEIVEECVKNEAFAQKYSEEVNGTTLAYSVIEAQNGLISLDDEDLKYILFVQAQTYRCMSLDEFHQSSCTAYNMLLLVKKYMPDYYDAYVDIMAEAALNSVQYPNYIEELYAAYYVAAECIPEWYIEVCNSAENSQNEYEYTMQLINACLNHIDGNDLPFITKIKLSIKYFDVCKTSQ